MRSLCLMSRRTFFKERIIKKENNRKREYEMKRIRDEENRIKLEFAFTIGSAVF